MKVRSVIDMMTMKEIDKFPARVFIAMLKVRWRYAISSFMRISPCSVFMFLVRPSHFNW